MNRSASALNALVPDGVTAGELVRNGRTLRIVTCGSGAPTIVLEAGGGDSALTWAPILPALAASNRVVVYDRAGLGDSDAASPLTLDVEIDDLVAVMTEVGNGPCILVGHSWGGLLAEMVSWTAPGQIAGLVLIDPSHEELLASLPWWIFAWMSMLQRWGIAKRSLGLRGRVAIVSRARTLSSDLEIQRLLIDALAADNTVAQLRASHSEGLLVKRSIGEIRRRRAVSTALDAPTVVLSATTGIPAKIRARWTGLQRSAAGRHIVVPDAGHYIHVGRPHVVVDAIHYLTTRPA